MSIQKLNINKLTNTSNNNFLNFGEYRKGSNEYGQFIQDIMLFLRNYNKDGNNLELLFKIKDIPFDIDKLLKLKNDDNKNRLISFDINFYDKNRQLINYIDKNGYVKFLNLNKKIDRPWESKENIF
jgi:hypothetical protein